MARISSARNEARKPPHLREMLGWMAKRVRRARVGTARAALAALTATRAPRPVWPRRAPMPPPTRRATTTTAKESFSWLQEQLGDAVGPGPVGPVGEPVEDLARKCMLSRLSRISRARPPRRTRRDQGTSSRSRPDQQEVGHGGQDDGQDQPDDDRGVVSWSVNPDVMSRPRPPRPIRNGHGDQADDGGGGHPEAGEDVRQGQGQVDPDQRGGRRVAHGSGRFPSVVGHGVQAGDGVPDEDQQGVPDERRSRPSDRTPRSR